MSGRARCSPGKSAVVVWAIALFFLLAQVSVAQMDEAARLLPTLEEVQRLTPGWFDEVRSEGTGRGSAYRVFRGRREIGEGSRVKRASVLLNITIRPRPAPPAPWGAAAWRASFEEKKRLLRRVPDLQTHETDLGDFAFIVTRSGGSHAEVTFYTEDLMVTVHNGTEELELAYPAEAEALKIARWMSSRMPAGGSKR